MTRAVEFRNDPTEQCHFQPILQPNAPACMRESGGYDGLLRELRERTGRLDLDEPGRLRRMAGPRLDDGQFAAGGPDRVGRLRGGS